MNVLKIKRKALIKKCIQTISLLHTGRALKYVVIDFCFTDFFMFSLYVYRSFKSGFSAVRCLIAILPHLAFTSLKRLSRIVCVSSCFSLGNNSSSL